MFKLFRIIGLFVLLLFISSVIVAPVMAQEVEASAPLISDSTFQIIFGALSIAAFVISVFAYFRANGDAGAAARIRQEQTNRQAMGSYEGMYQDAAPFLKTMFDTAARLVSQLAPLTPNIQTDDAVADWMKDIQTPGAPASPTPPPSEDAIG